MSGIPATPPAYRGVTSIGDLSSNSGIGSIVSVLVALRKANRLSQQQVADRMGTAQSAVSELENGTGGETRVSTLARYAEAVGAELKVTVQIIADLPVAAEGLQ